MTKAQRVLLMVELWPKACLAQGWNVKDDSRRHDLYASVLDAKKRAKDFTNRDFDKIKAALLALACSLQGAIEMEHPEIGEARRLRYVIGNNLIPELGRYVEHPELYLRALIRDKFGVVAGVKDWWNLSAVHPSLEAPSELEQLRMTLAARIVQLRREAGGAK